MARTIQDQVVIEHDVDVEWTVAEAWSTAVATMRVFQRMQPVIQGMWIKIAVDDRGGIEEITTLKSHRREHIRIREDDVAETFAQRLDRRTQVGFGIDIAAEAEVSLWKWDQSEVS